MNPEVKQKWVEALRSGRYKQGQGFLKNANEELCCLGVLCDITHPDMWDEPPTTTNSVFGFGGIMSATSPPLSLRGEVGLPDGPFYSIMDGALIDVIDLLIELNDAEHKDFLFIADWIEENL